MTASDLFAPAFVTGYYVLRRSSRVVVGSGRWSADGGASLSRMSTEDADDAAESPGLFVV